MRQYVDTVKVQEGRGIHTQEYGTRGSADVVLYEKHVRKYFIMYKTLQYVFEYRGGSGANITSVEARDHWDDDTGGHAEVISGGVGYSYVKVKVTSLMGRGFEFTVTVCGRK